jgi:hypothetical protein
MNIEKRLRLAALLVAAGLTVQLLSLLPIHPLAFIVFVGVGAPIMALGVIVFLWSLASHQTVETSPLPDRITEPV